MIAVTARLAICDSPHGSANPILTLLQATVFCDVCRQRGGMAHRHILSSRAHSDKIPTATSMFLRSYFLVGVLRFCGTSMCTRNPRWQPICRKYISETVTYIIKIPTTYRRKTDTNVKWPFKVTYLGSVERRQWTK